MCWFADWVTLLSARCKYKMKLEDYVEGWEQRKGLHMFVAQLTTLPLHHNIVLMAV